MPVCKRGAASSSYLLSRSAAPVITTTASRARLQAPRQIDRPAHILGRHDAPRVGRERPQPDRIADEALVYEAGVRPEPLPVADEEVERRPAERNDHLDPQRTVLPARAAPGTRPRKWRSEIVAHRVSRRRGGRAANLIGKPRPHRTVDDQEGRKVGIRAVENQDPRVFGRCAGVQGGSEQHQDHADQRPAQPEQYGAAQRAQGFGPRLRGRLSVRRLAEQVPPAVRVEGSLHPSGSRAEYSPRVCREHCQLHALSRSTATDLKPS